MVLPIHYIEYLGADKVATRPRIIAILVDMESQPIIRTRELGKSYRHGRKKNEVLHHINLNVREGEFLAIMGPSGSGKSTLIRLLGLIDTPSTGTIELFGKKLPRGDRSLSKLRNTSIGFVFQDYRLVPHYSVLDNVAVPLKIAGKRHSYQKKRANDLLKLVGLADVVDNKASELSGGQQQRVGIARALALQPKLLIADEPTGNLDSATGESIMKILRTVNAKLGTTIIMVTHSPDIARQASRTIILRDGHIVTRSSQ